MKYIEASTKRGETGYQLAEEVTLPSADGKEYKVLQPSSGDVPRTRKQLELLVADYRANAAAQLVLADKYQALLDAIPAAETTTGTR